MEIKQVIIVRRELNMRKGKLAAQVAHASMAVFTKNIVRLDPEEISPENPDDALNIHIRIPKHGLAVMSWLAGSFTKIVTFVNSEEELVACYEQALAAGLPCSLITDSGRTEFHNVPTKTTVAIGPAAPELIDKITGKLGLI